jgi:hypothetical protein
MKFVDRRYQVLLTLTAVKALQEARRTTAAVLFATLLLAGAARADLTLYVATNGNDAWSGTLPEPNEGRTDGPLATLGRAQSEIRHLKDISLRTGPLTVFVRGGVYELEQTFRISVGDSGTAAAPIVFRAYGNEKPVLTGARRISGFTPHKGRILKADVAAQGLRNVGLHQLYWNSKRQQLARYPNFSPQNPYGGRFAYVDGEPVSMYQEIPGEDKRTFHYKAVDARPWSHPEEGEVFIFPRYNWWNNIIPIESMDPSRRVIKLAGDCSYAIRPMDRYYVQNLFEELDAPGEWYLDRRTSTLYFWPPEGGAAETEVYAPRLRTLLELTPGTAHILFRGFTFEGSEGTAIELKDTWKCQIAGNTIRNAGDYNGSAVDVNGGRDNGVIGNDIYEIGSNGVSISGGDRITLTAANNYADNNYIHHVGVFYKQGVGILLNGCGLRASHNLIHDTPRHGITFAGNNLVIEYNHIRHVNLETEDTGAVATGGRDWISSRGTMIRYNFLHDMLGYGQVNGRWVSPHFAWGVYLDDNTGGVDVFGNIVARAVRGLVHLHNARDNIIENNILVGAKLQQVEYNGWTTTSTAWLSLFDMMTNGWESVQDQPAWKKMRGMNIPPSKAALPDGLIMAGNVFQRNIVYYTDPEAKLFSLRDVPFGHNTWNSNLYWHAGQPVLISLRKAPELAGWDEWRKLGIEEGSVVGDPLFVNPDKDDYRLRSGSPSLKLGFQPIPVEKIGPYQDELRASWPIVEAEGAREKPLSQ